MSFPHSNHPNLKTHSWDWTGSVPDVKKHQNWCQVWPFSKKEIVFTEEYVSKCINLAIRETVSLEDMSFQSKAMLQIGKNMPMKNIMLPIC